MKIKSLLCSIVCAAVFICNAFAVSLYVDNQKLSPAVPPVIVDGRTLVPMRAIFEALGAQVSWDDASMTATAAKADTIVSIQVGNQTAYAGGQAHALDVPAQLIQGHTMVPARFVSEALHAKVDWDAKTQTVCILTAGQGQLTIYFLDVGQADSILLTNGGEAMLIDAGSNAAGQKVVASLREKGVNRLKYAVGTHPHEDHIGGLDDVMNSYPVDEVLMPNVVTTTKTFSDVLDAIETNHVPLATPHAGDTYRLGDANIVVMNTLKSKDLNNASLVLQVAHGDNRFLLTGDAEAKSEADMLASGKDLGSNVLKVGHHGSNTSTTEAFLNAVSPTDAVISCGLNNKYGHPHEQILSRLANVRVWRTDLHGTVTLVSNGKTYSMTAEKNGIRSGT